jgi:hypothetical protein
MMSKTQPSQATNRIKPTEGARFNVPRCYLTDSSVSRSDSEWIALKVPSSAAIGDKHYSRSTNFQAGLSDKFSKTSPSLSSRDQATGSKFPALANHP